jgi:hypothetical protein
MSCGRSPNQEVKPKDAFCVSRRRNATPHHGPVRTTSKTCPMYVVAFDRPKHTSTFLFSQFCWMNKEELPEGATCGVRFTTLTIDTSQYLHWLCARFLAAGGSLVRGSVQHISQLSEGGARAFGGLAKVAHAPLRYSAILTSL